jgi:hypothetical protein
MPHLERAGALARSALGEDHLNALTFRSDLAKLYQSHDAEPVFVKVLEVRKRVLREKPRHPGLDDQPGRGLPNVASALDAETLLLQGGGAQAPLLEGRSLVTLDAMNNLAVVYLAQARYSDAEPLLVRQFEVLMRVDRERSSRTAYLRNSPETFTPPFTVCFFGFAKQAKAESALSSHSSHSPPLPA